jgi:hypothetical protein
VDDVILRGMAAEQNDRFASAGELARALEAAIGQLVEAGEGFDTEPAAARVTGPRTQPGFAVPAPHGDSKRTLTIELTPGAAEQPEPVSRGVVFRSVTRVLGLRTTAAWLRTIERDHQTLADALSLGTSPLAWVPAQLFRDLLATIAASGRNPIVFARELGCTVVEESFARFYPSSPGALSPETTLGALDILWRRYHSWGDLRRETGEARAALIAWIGPNDPATCGFIEGWLDRVVSLSGGVDPRVIHSHGDGRCEFATSWR